MVNAWERNRVWQSWCIVEYSCRTNSMFTMIRSNQFYHHVRKENLEKKLGKEYVTGSAKTLHVRVQILT